MAGKRFWLADGQGKQGNCTSIFVGAKLLTSIKSIRETMKVIPWTREVSIGTRLRYLLHDSNGRQDILIELLNNGLTFAFYSDTIVERGNAPDIIKLISILACLKGDYAVDISTIYPNIITALQNCAILLSRADQHACVPDRRIDELSHINSSVAGELVRTLAKLKREASAKEVYREFSVCMLKKLIGAVGGCGRLTADSLSAYGIEPGLSDRLVRLLDDEKTGMA